MRRKREFTEDAFYHVTSRTNNKIRVFENNLGRKIMLMVLQDAQNKFRFGLTNFCIMPTHIHLLIKPAEGQNLSVIMRWIKTRSAVRWNQIHGSTDHMWGDRYFARPVKDDPEYEYVMNYIDQNPVKAGLAQEPAEWKGSMAYYKARNIACFPPADGHEQVKLLSPIPPMVSRLLPPAQLSRITQYYGAYADTIDRLYTIVKDIPKLGDTETFREPLAYLHYVSSAEDYFIHEYDGNDIMLGKARSAVRPMEGGYRRFSLSDLKRNQYIKLDFSWAVSDDMKAPRR